MRKSELCHVFQGVLTRLNFQSLTGEFSFCIRRVGDSVNCDLSEALKRPILGMKLEKEKINAVLLTAEMCIDVDIYAFRFPGSRGCLNLPEFYIP